jgi:CBS domain-containing protein
VTVDRDTSLNEILDLLADEERDINRLPVVDGDELVGIVARQDVLRAIRDERRTDGV